MSNNYTIGVNSLGEYGMKVDRGNDNTKLSFSYSSLNTFSPTTNKLIFLNSPANTNMGQIGMSFNKRKPLTSKLDLFYGTDLNMFSNIYKGASINSPNTSYLPNLNLNIGLKYKFSENVSISATVMQGYGYGLGYTFGNSLFNPGMPFMFDNKW